MSSMRFRAGAMADLRNDTSAQRRRSLTSARTLIIVLMSIFIAVSITIMLAGLLPVARPTPLPTNVLLYKDLKAADEQVLTTYGWVDQGQGVARIPIERAKTLIVERGLPTRPQVEGQQQP